MAGISLSTWEFNNLDIVFSSGVFKDGKLMGLNFLQKCAQDSLLLHINDAATRIQARARGIKGRKLHAEKRVEKQQNLSATKIQAQYRGKRGRDKAKERKDRLSAPVTTETGHLAPARRDDEAYCAYHGDDSPPPEKAAYPPAGGASQAPPQPQAVPPRQVVPQGNGGSPQKVSSPAAGSARQAAVYFRNDVSGVLITEEQIRQLWAHYDVDGNGYLSKDEVKRIYQGFDSFGVEDGDKRVDTVLSKYNMMGDGKVTYDEFAILMLDIARR
eukprot:TRINITY_DN7000_c0_g1_i1.p1 TRINITY_DN7000_c0_g1~~TRINITY_DN7000_c0_g1_i1.p1  ORF type:complete len:302 (+),score=110.26 TRINITY_DN7000_c0_g1_i1:96-908(+)